VAFKAVTRNHLRAAEARRHFRRAAAEWRKLAGTRPGAGYRFRDDGQALRAVADRWHGAARFYLADASFEQMLAKKAGSAADVAAMFERAGEATPAWQVASAARVGQVLLHQGQPRRAAAAFQRCLKLSVEASHFDDFSRLCEAELGRLQPNQAPAKREIHGRSPVGPVMSRPALLPDPRGPR
jgi:tetratricopeptide (TPR) repeat protein